MIHLLHLRFFNDGCKRCCLIFSIDPHHLFTFLLLNSFFLKLLKSKQTVCMSVMSEMFFRVIWRCSPIITQLSIFMRQMSFVT